MSQSSFPETTFVSNTTLIAKFLGGDVYVTYESPNYKMYCIEADWVVELRESRKDFLIGGFEKKMLLDNCKFNERFDWIMLVIDKIEKLGYNVKIDTNYFMISRYNPIVQIFNEEKDKLKMVYRGVIMFLNEYNKDKNV